MKRFKSTLKEYHVETAILEYLNQVPGCFAFKVETSGYYNAFKGIYQRRKSPYFIKGTSDILGVYLGKFFAMEVKRPKGSKISDDQWNFIARVKLKGGIAGVVKSIEDARILLGIGEEKNPPPVVLIT